MITNLTTADKRRVAFDTYMVNAFNESADRKGTRVYVNGAVFEIEATFDEVAAAVVPITVQKQAQTHTQTQTATKTEVKK